LPASLFVFCSDINYKYSGVENSLMYNLSFMTRTYFQKMCIYINISKGFS
jgi:hypothetical protein